jgi:hypothetical protein
MSPSPSLSLAELLDERSRVSPRLRRQRTIEINRARAQIWLACETLGAEIVVIVLNEALREWLDRLGEESRT